jgi:type II secretory pathway component PulF
MAQLTFAYTALDSTGQKRTGAVDAENQDAAIHKLTAEGRFVLEIREQAVKVESSSSKNTSGKKPTGQDLALFSRRLSDLASAGLPLDRALSVVAEQSENAVLQKICGEALVDVRGGMPVSQALGKHSKYFNSVFTQTLRAGEASGQFGEVAGKLADYQELEVTRKGQISSALVYPALLVCIAVGVVVFVLTFILPKLSGTFQSMGDKLPITTKMLLSASDGLTHNWIAILLTIVVVVAGLRAWFSTPAGAEQKDRLMLTMPLVGRVIEKSVVSRFARILGTLVFGGVPILDALEIAGLSANNLIFLKSARLVEEEVRAGRPIAEAMRNAGAFPPVLTHMVAVGEETGNLPKMLGRVSDSLDFEVDVSLRRIVSLIEPAMILFMGCLVGFVVLSVLLPIFQSQDAIK